MFSLAELIDRSNSHKLAIEEYRNLDGSLLVAEPSSGGWNLLQVIEHLNLIYALYLPNIGNAIDSCPDRSEPLDEYKRTISGKMMIGGVKPRKGKRKMRMRTFKFFTPANELEIDDVFRRFADNQTYFSNQIREARMKDHRKGKVVSALGPVITFQLGECFDFLLAHEERHLLQMKEILENIK